MQSEANPSKVVRFLPGILIRRAPADHLLARPLVVDSPHSGRAYPEDFGHAAPLALLRRAEDAFVDDLFEAAPQHGAEMPGQKGHAIETLTPAEFEKWKPLLKPVTDDWVKKVEQKGQDGRKLLEDLAAMLKATPG